MRMVLLVVVLLVVAGCGEEAAGDVTLGIDDHLGEVDVGVGATIDVELESNASTGFSWVPSALPAFLELREDRYLEPDTDLVGAAGTQVLAFEVLERGAGILRLEYVRSFDDPPVPDRVVEFVVRVDGAPWPPSGPGPTPSVTAAEAPMSVDDLAVAEPGPVAVEGFVVWEAPGARLCGALLESFPAQCGGTSIEITNPDALDVRLDEEQGVRWTASAVVLSGEFDGARLTVDG